MITDFTPLAVTVPVVALPHRVVPTVALPRLVVPPFASPVVAEARA